LAGERALSWQVALGAKPDAIGSSSMHPYINGSLGGGADLSDQMTAYSLIGLDLHYHLAVINDSGVVYRWGDWGVRANMHIQQARDERLWHTLTGTIQYQLTKNSHFRFWLSNRDDGLAYQYFW